MVEIRLMEKTDHASYSALLETSSYAMFTHSLEYLNYLEAILDDCQPMHLVAVDNNGIVCGALPLMSKDAPQGRVLNSLPYYGSHGSLILGTVRRQDARWKLLQAVNQLSSAPETLASTLIGNPLDSVTNDLWNQTDFEDERISQMTILPSADSHDTAAEAVFSLIHGKTRNLVKKGMSQGYRIWHSDGNWELEELHRLHSANLSSIGGLAKTKHSLEMIPTYFDYDQQYRVYCASQADQIIAALLVFYFKDHVEYFMPAVDREHRSNQALSALIFTAMNDSIVQKQSKLWNWGGTWRSQTSLHHFKSRWGARDTTYSYATRLGPRAPKNLRLLDPELLAKAYPNFFVLPYSVLAPEAPHGSYAVRDANESKS